MDSEYLKKAKQLLKRLMVLASIKLFVGSLIFFLNDKIIGFAVIGIGLTTLIWTIFLHFKIKNNQKINIKRSLAHFHILLGSFILALSLLIFMLYGKSEYFKIIIKLIIGFILILRGIWIVIFR